ncbi:MAG TPA: methylated-DNA--[protein]-cysteine S-methyltransferase [Candidatus Elarobacter sp.]|jgi:O-6-methylguanine DNA methyltransferase|nr:methylated-DNA--[protein]-cysteine S-methyltransferase [Candidatus Elarobacter sp.]
MADLHDYGAATRRSVASDFTTKIFVGIGLDRYAEATSALGEVYVAWSARGVSAVRLAGDEAAFEAWYRERFACGCVPAVEDDEIVAAARAKLWGQDVEVPLDLRACSEFEQRVLRRASEIGHGHARSYGWLAREAGAPEAKRAVGNALGANPVPLLIPCHRVIRADNSVGGYVFGSEAKRKLLEREGVDFAALAEVARRGFRYIGCDDGSFCLPTCGGPCGLVAQHLDDDSGYFGLHSLEEAHAHGLVPCKQCRPVAA